MPLVPPALKGLAASLVLLLSVLVLLVAVDGASAAAAGSAKASAKSPSAKKRASAPTRRSSARRGARRCGTGPQRARGSQSRRTRRKGKRAPARAACRRAAQQPRTQQPRTQQPRKVTQVSGSASVSGHAVPASGGPLRIGLVANTQVHDQNAGSEQDLAKQTGAGWLREEFDWDVIEPQNDQWSWTRYDTVLEQAAQRGLRVLPLLNGSASWAAPRWNQFPDDLGEYGEYVAKVTERYGPGGSFWRARPELAAYAPSHFELWNEPYIEYFSIDKVSPSRYAQLAKAGAAAGRAANPSAKFLLSADTYYTESAGDYRNWIDGMYAAVPDLNSYFDAVAVHPYSGGLSPDTYTPGQGTRWQFRRLEEMRARFVAHGAAAKKFWITELGWATCTGNEDCVSEQQQAQYLSRVFAYAKGEYASFMEAVFVYHLRDWGPADQTNKEYWFGLRRKDGTPKPAFDTLRGISQA
jgi:polysaccharide biosynthesis protein PslG